MKTLEFWVRVYPTEKRDWDNVKLDDIEKTIHIRNIEDLKRLKKSNNLFWRFKTDGILQNISQENVFVNVLPKDLLQKVLDGYNLIVIAFGATGTGKSHTISGINTKYEFRGIVPRLLEYLFKYKQKSEYDMDISMTYVEIIGKDIYNLLRRNKPKENVEVKAVRVDSACKAFEQIFNGNCRRKIENICVNCATAVLTIQVSCHQVRAGKPVTVQSKFHIVDMGGIESGKKTIKSQQCHNEANLTKCYLNTLWSWADGELNDKIPGWRVSKLATYLGKSLNTGYIRFIGHIKVTNDSLSDTTSTLQFGRKLTKLEYPQLVQMSEDNKEIYIKELEKQVEDMKEVKIINNIVNGIYMPETVSQNHIKHVLNLVKSFFNSQISEECLWKIAHPVLLLQIMKEFHERELREVTEELNQIKEEKDSLLHKSGDGVKILKTKQSWNNVKTKKKKKGSSGPLSDTSYSQASVLGQAKTEENEKEKTECSTRPKEKYDFSVLQLEYLEEGERNFEKIFDEFLQKTPSFKAKLSEYTLARDESFKIKNIMLNTMLSIKYELNKVRINTENKKWELALDDSEKVGCALDKRESRHCAVDLLEFEATVLEEKFQTARNKAMEAHKEYIDARTALNEMMKSVETQYTDYVMYLYNTSIIIPRVDCKIMAIPKVTESESNKDEMKLCFEKLQNRPVNLNFC